MSEDEALAGYRAAVAFISADSWDGCSDCIEVLKAARAADWNNEMAGNSDAVAEHLKRIRKHYTNPVEAGLTAQSAELEALRGEVEPVRHWYESDEHSPRSDVEVLKDIVADLQSDRAENLKLRARVAALEEAAAKVLPFNVENGPDYASVYFGDGSTHSTQAMTMNPQDWFDLEAALRALLNQNGEA